MYYQHFGLQEPPFSIAVNPRYLYMSPRHRDALAHLLYGVGAGGGFILLTGEVGTGKTTLNRCLIEQLPDTADVAIVLNPALDSRDLLATVCEELQIEIAATDDGRPGLKALTDALHQFLLANHGAGRKTVLIIDEAQHLSFEVLEQIRLLTNLETHDEKLLHIILIGQPELADKLQRPELRQLNQRITARYELQPLNADETAAYIRHRLQVAGMPAGHELFSAALARRIHRRSNGVPRVINLLCDRMLMGAYGRGSDRVDSGLLSSAAAEVLGDTAAGPRGLHWAGFAAAAVLLAGVLAAALLPLGPQGDAPPAAVSQTAPEESAPATVTEAASPPPWVLNPAAGAALYAAVYGVTVPGDNPCALPAAARLRCERGSAETWNALLAQGRPLLLELADENRFAARAVFLGVADDSALLADSGGVTRAPLRELAERWRGGFWLYWQVPDWWTGPLSSGASGPAVGELASVFARLDGQANPLSSARYSGALAERVRIFQRARGLNPDGVVGEQTLRELVLAAGSDLDLTAALAQVEARSAAGQWP